MKTADVQIYVRGQPSWRIATSGVEAHVTRQGGRLGPVSYDCDGRRGSPYTVAPWADESDYENMPAMLQVLHGDFFCLPVGGNAAIYQGEQHPPHGETANAEWKCESVGERDGSVTLHLSLEATVREGRVDKYVILAEGHSAVYVQHVVSGMQGPMSVGHHAMLQFPDALHTDILSTSNFHFGQVAPESVERPEEGSYCLLPPGAAFLSLDEVPTVTGEHADLSRYPARRCFEDLVMLVGVARAQFAWTAVTFPRERYVWFALKNSRLLCHTVLWFSNGGRHYPPWEGRQVNVLGLEEVTAYFHYGLAESVAANPIAKRRYPTSLQLHSAHPLVVPYVMAVTPVPPDFDRVASIQAIGQGEAVALQAASGAVVTAPLNLHMISHAEIPDAH